MPSITSIVITILAAASATSVSAVGLEKREVLDTQCNSCWFGFPLCYPVFDRTCWKACEAKGFSNKKWPACVLNAGDGNHYCECFADAVTEPAPSAIEA